MAKRTAKSVEALTHEEASRRNIPTAEHEAVMAERDRRPIEIGYERRNRDLDPQLVWRGKDVQDLSDFVVQAPPLFIQEKVHPKALIADLLRQTKDAEAEQAASEAGFQADLFADFNGLPDEDARTEFYQHDANWSNRMILGDSLQVMASLAEREGLRGKVQCICVDPPYGIKFNSNFQWSTTSRDVKDGKADHITREPEQVKAFRDTWRDGIHSYLTYLRDRLTVARDLLAESGSIFVQIGDENVRRVRVLMDEVFGENNFIAQITFRVKSPLAVSDLARTTDFIVWYAKDQPRMKFRQAKLRKKLDGHPEFSLVGLPNGMVISRQSENNADDFDDARFFTAQNLGSSGYTPSCMYDVAVEGKTFKHPRGKSWKTNQDGMRRLHRADRLQPLKTSLRWRYYFDDAPSEVITDVWVDTFAESDKTCVVQTSELVTQRCLLMTTDPGDLRNTGKGNLFVVFGEPDIDLLPVEGNGADAGQFQVKLNGVDVFHPNTGEVHSDGADGIACWFIDTDYDEESFLVRHAYFLGAGDPYKALKTTLKAEINQDAWATLRSDLSRPFDRPSSGRIAVKVINHLGDEVMKVFRV